jgi:hypothetical protein
MKKTTNIIKKALSLIAAAFLTTATYAPILICLDSQSNAATVTYWNAATEFWWNASWNDPTPENGSNAWDSAAAQYGGRISQSESRWSYGLLNTTGGDPVNDPYPISITQTTSGPNNRGAFGQFWDSTTSGSYTYAPIGAGGLYLYNFLGTQIGVYGTPWFNLAPGFDGEGAGRVGTPNLTHMWLQSSDTGAGSDGLASALRWTATEAGTYRFYGEFVPGGTTGYSQSFAILKSSPVGVDNSGDTTLLSRSTVVDDGPVTSYDVTAILGEGETVTWVVGTNGGPANMMGVQAQVALIPEPSTGSLIMFGIASLMALKVMRRKKCQRQAHSQRI